MMGLAGRGGGGGVKLISPNKTSLLDTGPQNRCCKRQRESCSYVFVQDWILMILQHLISHNQKINSTYEYKDQYQYQ